MSESPALPPDGFEIGHWSNEQARTGCTVLLAPEGSRGGVFVAGGGPASREIDVVRPLSNAPEVHAVVLTGGSAFGLAVADGVMAWLEERGRGYLTPGGLVPIVPVAALYDLSRGDASVRPGPAEGRAACEAAKPGVPARGPVGAGTGASVAKLHGPDSAIRAGVGYGAVALGTGETVAALVAVNATGDVVDADGSALAAPGGGPEPLSAEAIAGMPAPPEWTAERRENTTLACICTDVPLTKAECSAVARMASAGLARAIDPVFSPFDGDICFVVSSGEGGGDGRSGGTAASWSVMRAGSAAATAVATAIRDALPPR